jgi:hypothetical protein
MMHLRGAKNTPTFIYGHSNSTYNLAPKRKKVLFTSYPYFLA